MTIAYRTLLASAAVPAVVLMLNTTACAQDVRTFDVAAGPLDSALIAYSRQSGQQVLYTSAQVAGRTSPGVRGRFGSVAALDQILTGTGLVPSQSRPGVFVLRSVETALLDEAVVDEIVVTGTLLRGPAATPSPVTVVGRDLIDRDGRADVAEAIAALPQNYAGSGTPVGLLALSDPIRTNGALATSVNLRGLGPDATLVLVNGRRMGGTGTKGDFADLSAIPTAAVDRVDVLLDGASAIYGSDAVGGVVNIILRRSLEGSETRLRASASRGGAESLTFAHTAGWVWDSGTGLLSYEYQDQNGLAASDRDYAATGDLRPFGGSDRRLNYAAPGNIVGFNPATGTFTSLFAIRPGADGVANTASEFAAGETNLSNRQAGINLLPNQRSDRLYAFVRQDLTDRIELTADARYSDRRFDYPAAPAITIAQVTNRNPTFFSPSGATSHQIAYSFAEELGNTTAAGFSESLGVSLGVNVRLPGDWRLETYGAFAREESQTEQTDVVHSLFLAEALGTTADSPDTAFSAARDGYLNLFGAGAANSASVLDFISSGYARNGVQGETASLNALAQGTIFELPGGPVRLAFGAQYRTEGLKTSGEQFLQTVAPRTLAGVDYERSLRAAFVEARVPLFGSANARPGLKLLELSLAARIEDYEDFGDTTNPKLGVVWSPTQRLRVRSSWGTSFRAPALTELNEGRNVSAVDVVEGTVSRLALLELGGNPDLRPETAESFTIGFDLEPTITSGLRASFTLFETRFEDQIARPGTELFASALIDPALGPFVRRITPGSADDLAAVNALLNDPTYRFPGVFPPSAFAAIIDGRWVNTSDTLVRGLDGSISYGFNIGDHAFTLEGSASYLIDYDQALTPAADTRSLLNTVNAPVDLRGTIAGIWTRGDWLARFALNHVADYEDAVGRTIDAWNTFDTNLHWTPSQGWAEGLRLSLNLLNVFDEDPPFYDAPSGIGFDPGQANALGRTVSFQLTKRW